MSQLETLASISREPKVVFNKQGKESAEIDPRPLKEQFKELVKNARRHGTRHINIHGDSAHNVSHIRLSSEHRALLSGTSEAPEIGEYIISAASRDIEGGGKIYYTTVRSHYGAKIQEYSNKDGSNRVVWTWPTTRVAYFESSIPELSGFYLSQPTAIRAASLRENDGEEFRRVIIERGSDGAEPEAAPGQQQSPISTLPLAAKELKGIDSALPKITAEFIAPLANNQDGTIIDSNRLGQLINESYTKFSPVFTQQAQAVDVALAKKQEQAEQVLGQRIPLPAGSPPTGVLADHLDILAKIKLGKARGGATRIQ